MHDSAYRIGELVMHTYCDLPNASILEIGSMDVNGSLRDAAEPTTNYVGVDLEEGRGVDVVIKPGETLPFEDDSFDLIMASSAFEHDPRFWDTFLEMCRVARPGGHIYVNAPSNGGVHRYPMDCWRFYPDAGIAMVDYVKSNNVRVELVESFVGKRSVDSWDGWNDFVAIFRKGPDESPLNLDFVHKRYPSNNVKTWNSPDLQSESAITEDMQLGRDFRQKIAEYDEKIAEYDEKIIEYDDKLKALFAELDNVRQKLNFAEKLGEKLTGEVRVKTAEAQRNREGVDWLRAVHVTLAYRRPWWVLLPAQQRRKREYELLRTAGLFDVETYLARHPDVAAKGEDPLHHYVAHGIDEGRDRG